jgi:two-component system, NtrC family, response regulator AtoC
MPLALDLSRYPVLVVDDEQDNLDIVRFNFRKVHPLLFATGGEEALALLRAHEVACIVCDQRMPGMTGIELLRAAREVRPDTVNILLTAWADLPLLTEALNGGLAYRYLGKPWSSEELGLALRGAVERYHLLEENARLLELLKAQNQALQRDAAEPFNFGEIVGEARALKAVLGTVAQVAPTPSTVLIRGESGVGKELVARAIHNASPRAGKAFVRVNCAALAPGVLESELFGHEKGAFTGAVARKLGRFELADGGTLFLDEVGDLTPEIQVKLLRVLQEREFERVGGTETLTVDVRVISATNRDLEAAMAQGAFREDLYYRLNVFPVQVPPLRERLEDVDRLARHFVARFAPRCGKKVDGLTAEAVEKLKGYWWPGNVRELENVLERAIILCQGAQVGEGDLDFGARRQAAAPPSNLSGALEDLEKRKLLEAIDKHRGRKSDIARELGINRSTLYYRLKKHGLE